MLSLGARCVLWVRAPGAQAVPSLLPKRAGPQRALSWPAEVFAMAAALPALSQAVAKPPEFKGISCSLSVFQQET